MEIFKQWNTWEAQNTQKLKVGLKKQHLLDIGRNNIKGEIRGHQNRRKYSLSLHLLSLSHINHWKSFCLTLLFHFYCRIAFPRIIWLPSVVKIDVILQAHTEAKTKTYMILSHTWILNGYLSVSCPCIKWKKVGLALSLDHIYCGWISLKT